MLWGQTDTQLINLIDRTNKSKLGFQKEKTNLKRPQIKSMALQLGGTTCF